MRRICLDLTPCEMHDRHGGIGNYGQQLLAALRDLGDEPWRGLELLVLTRSDRPPRPASEVALEETIARPILPARRHRWQRRLLVGSLLRVARVDLFHALHPGSLPIGAPPVVATAHDLIPVVLPEPTTGVASALLRRWEWLEQAARHLRPRHLIAISQTTRRDLARVFRIAERRVTVIPLGVDHTRFHPLDPAAAAREGVELRARHRLPPRFFLSVGSDHYRKNQRRLIDAWRRTAARSDHGLVIVGRALYATTLQALERELRAEGLVDRVRLLDAIGDGELPALYRAATALVAPSLYEGFGLTLLEAMACGAPVTASRAGSHPEVGGDAALLFDPLSEADLSATLLRIAGDGELRRRLREDGLARAAGFSWRATASATLALYRRLLALD